MRRVWTWIIMIAGAVGSLLMLLAGARRRGAQEARVEADAALEAASTEEQVQRAGGAVERALRAEARLQQARERAAQASTPEGVQSPIAPPEAIIVYEQDAEEAKQEAQIEAAKIRDRILRRTKPGRS